MGSIKDINAVDLTEAEDIKKRWQEYTEELNKKNLHDPDNHDGVITHLEPDILECGVKAFSIVNEAEVDIVFCNSLAFLWSNTFWQFDFWSLSLF